MARTPEQILAEQLSNLSLQCARILAQLEAATEKNQQLTTQIANMQAPPIVPPAP